MTQPQAFEAPGPGEWQCLVDHYPSSVTPEYRRLVDFTLPPGLTAAFQRFGIPAKGIALVWIAGRPFMQPIPMVGKPGSLMPPKPLLWLALRLVPMARRSVRVAADALSERPWREDAARWYETQRPQWIARNLALQSEDPAALDDEAFIDHLMRARENARDGYRLHFELHGPDFLPTGLLMVRGEEWGLERDKLFAALHGWSPASRGEELDESLNSWRMVSSYDIDGRTLGELPGLRERLDGRSTSNVEADRKAADAIAAELRSRVPAGDRVEFNRLLDDARLTYGIRDDNGGITGGWTTGLFRRAYLDAGKRLAVRRTIADEAHVFELLVEEIADLLRGKDGPSAAAIAERAAERRAESDVAVPSKVGPPPKPIPFQILPPALSLLGRAQLLIAEGLSSEKREGALAGTGVGESSYTGRACVALDPVEALDRIADGDVLVTKATTPAWNVAISLAGALVVEEAGVFSHAAVMARELGLPAVLGVPGVTAAIADGATIEVDPTAGRVRIVEAVH